MLISRNWMADYVAVPDDVAELDARLTAAGLAIEGIDPVGDDIVLDVDITTNRPDCMNHFGMARELAVLTGKELRPPKVDIHEVEDDVHDIARVVVEDAELCPRFSAIAIRGVEVGPSPEWLVRRLEAIGSRAINNVVDITNYVLWETGQPMHAYDFDRLADAADGKKEIRVRLAQPGEKIVTLDSEERTLDGETLVIADASGAIGLGGIMGGLDSEVTEVTTDVLLEAAHFNPKTVQQGSKRLGLKTDASHRFERGADPEGNVAALRRAATLIVELAGGEVLSGVLDEKNLRPDWPPVVEMDLAKLNRFGGIEIDAAEVERTFTGLGFGIESLAASSQGWRITVPSWRYYDFENAYVADFYEEALRIHGFDDIPSTLPGIVGSDGSNRPEYLRTREARDLLAAIGYAEAITFAFTDRASDDGFANLFGDSAALPLKNPLSDRWAVMHRSLLSNLTTSARYNQRRGAAAVRLFEIGHIFADDGAGGRVELEAVALVAGGVLGTPWEGPRPINFFDLKGAVDSLAATFGVELAARPARLTGLRDGASAELCVAGSDDVVGHLGQIDDDDGPYPLFAAELALDRLPIASANLTTHPPSKYPAITIDSTLTHSLETSWAEIARVIEESRDGDLKEFGLKDRYRGKGVPEGAVNSTLYFLYNSDETSLQQDDVNERHTRLAGILEARFAHRTDA